MAKHFTAGFRPKERARPSARRPSKFSEYDKARLQYHSDEIKNTGLVYNVLSNDAGKWSSAAFNVNDVNNILGRIATKYEGPNKETKTD